MSSLKGYAYIGGCPWSGYINMYRHKVQDLNSGIVVPMTSYLLGSAYVSQDGSFHIEYSWNGTSLTAVAGSASTTSGGGSYYFGRRAIVGGFSPTGVQGAGGNRVGSRSASMQQFGSSRSYDAYAGRWCWFDFPLEGGDGDAPSVYITRVNINASPNTSVEWTEADMLPDSDATVDWSWEIHNNGDLWIERGWATGDES